MSSALPGGPAATTGVLRALATLSLVELATLGVLMTNVLTVHTDAVSRIMGPLHGAAYLSVVAVALLARGLTRRTRIGATIPVLGGVLTLHRVGVERRRLTESAHRPPPASR